jgi:hypothetical protein
MKLPINPIHPIKKEVHVFTVDHCIDIITNSSSELFILDGDSKKIVEELLESTCPGYLAEYLPLQGWEDLENGELFAQWCERLPYNTSAEKAEEYIPEGFTFEELFSWDSRGNLINNYDAVNDSNRNHMINYLSKGKQQFFLYSRGDNPSYDMSCKLQELTDKSYQY